VVSGTSLTGHKEPGAKYDPLSPQLSKLKMLCLKPHVELKHIAFHAVGLLRPYLVQRGQKISILQEKQKTYIKYTFFCIANELPEIPKLNYHHNFGSARRSFVSPVKLMFCGLSGATRALYSPTAVCLPPFWKHPCNIRPIRDGHLCAKTESISTAYFTPAKLTF